jgi:hypothetical protein
MRDDNFLPRLHSIKEDPFTLPEQYVFDQIAKETLGAQPKMSQWEGKKSAADIARSEAFVADRERKFGEKTERSILLEMIIEKLLDELQWLSDDEHISYVIKTTKLDDYANNADLVVEISGDGDEEPIRFVIDVTNANSQDTIISKFEKIKEKLDKGIGTKIEYYYSALKDEYSKSTIYNLPNIVFPMNNENIQILCSYVSDLIKSGKKDKKKPLASLNKLQFDKCQLSMLEEIIKQTSKQMARLEAHGKTDTAIYKNLLNLFNFSSQIYQNKKGLPEIDSQRQTFALAKTNADYLTL